LPKLQQGDLVSGNAASASSHLANAKGDYWAAKSLEEVGDKIRDATYQSNRTWSGGNLDNTIRNRITDILKDKKERGRFTDKEIELMEQINKGAPVQNLMRAINKALPRGGVMGSLLTGAAVASPLGAFGLAVPVIGEGSGGGREQDRG